MFKCEAAVSAVNRAMALEREGYPDISAKLVAAAVTAEIGFLAEGKENRSVNKVPIPVLSEVS